MRINRRWLEAAIDQLGRIGETPMGGLARRGLSDRNRLRATAWSKACAKPGSP